MTLKTLENEIKEVIEVLRQAIFINSKLKGTLNTL